MVTDGIATGLVNANEVRISRFYKWIYHNIFNAYGASYTIFYLWFSRRTRRDEFKSPEFDIDNFTSWNLNKVFTVWGVDPGVKDLFMANDRLVATPTSSLCNQRRKTTMDWLFSITAQTPWIQAATSSITRLSNVVMLKFNVVLFHDNSSKTMMQAKEADDIRDARRERESRRKYRTCYCSFSIDWKW